MDAVLMGVEHHRLLWGIKEDVCATAAVLNRHCELHGGRERGFRRQVVAEKGGVLSDVPNAMGLQRADEHRLQSAVVTSAS